MVYRRDEVDLADPGPFRPSARDSGTVFYAAQAASPTRTIVRPAHHLVSSYDAIAVEWLNVAGMLRTNMFSHRMASQRWAAYDHILERGEWPSRRTNGEQGLGIRAKHRFAATGKRRQIPAEEETGSSDPYHYPWSGVVAKTPQRRRRRHGTARRRRRSSGRATTTATTAVGHRAPPPQRNPATPTGRTAAAPTRGCRGAPA